MITKFDFEKTEIEGLIEVTPFYSDDIRGGFTKDYSKELFQQNGIVHDLKETFYTTSFRGVIRAIHFQRVIQQPKLIRCIHGHVYDVVVDFRVSSPTFKKWIGFDLTEKNRRELLIPAGCGHGYLVIEDSIVSYKCSEKFYGEYDDGVLWNDPDLAIQWPTHFIGGEKNMIISEKDKNLMSFQTFIKQYGGL